MCIFQLPVILPCRYHYLNLSLDPALKSLFYLYRDVYKRQVDNHKLIEDELKVIKRERDRMVTILKNYKDILILPLNANFITIKTSKAQILYNECEKRSISIRAYGNELKDVVRITVGSKEENDEVIDAIKEVF